MRRNILSVPEQAKDSNVKSIALLDKGGGPAGEIADSSIFLSYSITLNSNTLDLSSFMA